MYARNRRRANFQVRKKRKRLDAISEEIYNRCRALAADLNDANTCTRPASPHVELRRSSRVRRAPVILDSSPHPVKKRKKIMRDCDTKIIPLLKGKREELDGPLLSVSLEDQNGSSTWRSRLRSRARNCTFGLARRQRLFGKRKLFYGMESECKGDYTGEHASSRMKANNGSSTIMKSRRSFKIRAINPSMNWHEKAKRSSEENGTKSNEEADSKETLGGEPPSVSVHGLGGNHERVANGCEEKLKASTETHLEKYISKGNFETAYRSDKEVEVPACARQRSREMHDLRTIRLFDGRGEYKFRHRGSDKEAKKPLQLEGKPGEIGESLNFADAKENCNKDSLFNIGKEDKVDEDACNIHKTGKSKDHNLSLSNLKEGRRCGLCGGGMDGKPPKRLVHDMGESENEECSGSSVSEEPNYNIWDGFGDEPGWLGRLLGPVNDRHGIARIWIHQNCAVWSPEVYFAGLGCLKNIRIALSRGRGLKCARCGRRGATIGCRVDKCIKTYHLPCARANGCHFDHRTFLIACTDHKKFFQPHGNQYLAMIKKLKAKKMKLEMRKLANDAFRKDLEAEEKWLENCGEDEEFIKRESKRLHRDLLRIAPVYVGGSHSENAGSFQGWESVAGLQDVVHSMKEVVILPLLYPEFFTSMGLQPPRGVLLHGHPGTGKTLVVRALIGSCSRGDKQIAYFSRKGADCLGKYVGDAERQLRLLFHVAEKSQPSIIFFDEIDGLAPCRSRQQDQTHNSVVSTLLALMDGLKSRGSVVVIGATNRPDAIDPALRRPGRFDREIYFPLPSVVDRASILSLHTKKWPRPIFGPLLKRIAENSEGFAGADLQALCTQAAMTALKRRCPLQQLLRRRKSKSSPWAIPDVAVEESDWLEALAHSSPPCSRRDASTNDVARLPIHLHLLPPLLHPLCFLLISLYDQHAPLSNGFLKAAKKLKSIFEVKEVSISCIQNLLGCGDVTKEIVQTFSHLGIICTNRNSYSDPGMDEGDENIPSKNFLSKKSSTNRILITGAPKCGQSHIASCLLYGFARDIEVQKVDAATIFQDGHGDMAVGITRTLARFIGMDSCIIFMPRIDLWAVESCKVNDGEGTYPRKEHINYSGDDESSALLEGMEPNLSFVHSHSWSSFVEQLQSLPGSSSFVLLATSEMPDEVLPQRIRDFFQGDAPNSTGRRLPHLTVQLDGDYDRDKMIDYSISDLVQGLIQVFIQFIHHKCHTPDTHQDSKCDNAALVFPNETDAKLHYPNGSPKPAYPNAPKLPKVRPELQYAICTLGYQILHSPHFAYLCWVTSKLKEGPSVELPQLGKRWPFNSCVVRPISSDQKIHVIRGLVAVGLSAYRGAYSSSRDVCHDVHEVLSLLVAQIHPRIRTKTDRCRFITVLTQAHHLEDIIDSWAFSVQSLVPEDVAGSSVNPRPPGEDSIICSQNGSVNEDGDASLEADTITKFSPPVSGLSAYSEIVCLYSFCSVCLHNLQSLLQGVACNEMISQKIPNNIDGMHDFISRFSAKLVSQVLEIISSGRIPAILENCTHHSETDVLDSKNTHSHAFRNGLLVDMVDSDQYHCKFEKLCLCSLTDWLLQTQHLKPEDHGRRFGSKYSKSSSRNVKRKS